MAKKILIFVWVLCGIYLGGCAMPKFNVSCSVLNSENEINKNEEKKKTVLDKCKENPEFKISVPF